MDRRKKRRRVKETEEDVEWYADLHRWLQITGLPYRRKLLFLGGYVERGSSHYEEYGIECLSFIASLKLAYPRHVFMLRGSAETTFSFAPRYNVPMDDAVLSAARQMCNCMPLTALIDEEYLAVSSGISPYMMEDLFEIEGLERPLRPEALPHSLKWLLFGQPSSMSGQFDFNEDNLKFRYGLRAVHRICQKWGLKAIIRSRNDISINPLFFLDNHFITINSCPTKKTGGVAMLIDGNLGWFFFKLRYQMEELEFSPDPYTSFLKNEDKKNE
uniref:SER_THR_PHOSPHATASE domain-containing protein n=1 Tax=Caenorhabditis tropicalis TaxID=1561998 RepID=A0A1I7V3C8_9PELO